MDQMSLTIIEQEEFYKYSTKRRTQTATTQGVYFAETPADLKNVTDNIVQSIISETYFIVTKYC